MWCERVKFDEFLAFSYPTESLHVTDNSFMIRVLLPQVYLSRGKEQPERVTSREGQLSVDCNTTEFRLREETVESSNTLNRITRRSVRPSI